MPCSLTGKFTNPDTTSDTPGYVRFDLYNTGGNYPQVNGAAIAPSQQFTLSATDGSWSGTIYRNDEISVNGSFSTYWHVRYFVSGQQVGPALDYYITTSTATIGGIGGLAPITQYPAPAPPAQPLVGAASSLASFPLAATTWTNVHNMGTQSVVVQCYDANFNQIIPDNVQNTSINQTVVTFLEPQAGFMVVMNVGNWTPSVTNPNYLIGNPTSSQGITGDYPFTLGGSLAAKRIEGVRYADQFSSIAAAYADISAGGTVFVPPGYSETFASNLTLNKANTSIVFLGSATITMGSSQVIVPAGTHGVTIRGTILKGGGSGASAEGVTFSYTGTSNAFAIGSSLAETDRFMLENVRIDIENGGTAAACIYLTYCCESVIRYVKVNGVTGSSSQTLITFDSTGFQCIDNAVDTCWFNNGNKGLVFTQPNATFNNHNQLHNSSFSGTGLSGTVALQIGNSDSYTIIGNDFNTWGTGFQADCQGSFFSNRYEGNTTDTNLTSNSAYNFVFGDHDSAKVTDSGAGNTVFTRFTNPSAQFNIPLKVGGTPVLPATTGGTLYIASGGGSPVSGRFYIGDGSGWKLAFAKRTGSTTTDEATISDSGQITANSQIIGGGTTLARYARYTPTLSPSSVAANTTAEQTFTNVLTSGDVVVGVSKPTAQAGLGIVGWRASGTSLCITFSNNTAGAITPTASEQYAVIAVQ